MSPLLLLLELQNVLRGFGQPHVKSLESWSDFPLTPHGSNWGHKKADFVFLLR